MRKQGEIIIGIDLANGKDVGCTTKARRIGDAIQIISVTLHNQERKGKRDRRYTEGPDMQERRWGHRRSNNWARMHGYAMRKRATRWWRGNPILVNSPVKPTCKAKGFKPDIVIIDELHEYKG